MTRIFEMMSRSFERDNINFIRTQVKNFVSGNLKRIYTEISFMLLKCILFDIIFRKRTILLEKSLNFL